MFARCVNGLFLRFHCCHPKPHMRRGAMFVFADGAFRVSYWRGLPPYMHIMYYTLYSIPVWFCVRTYPVLSVCFAFSTRMYRHSSTTAVPCSPLPTHACALPLPASFWYFLVLIETNRNDRTGVPKKLSSEALEFTINALVATRVKLDIFLSKVPSDALREARAEIKSEAGSES